MMRTSGAIRAVNQVSDSPRGDGDEVAGWSLSVAAVTCSSRCR